MIPVNELRINNYVYYNNEYNELGVITEIKTSLIPKINYVGINNRVDIYYQTKNINPILLSEKWLLNFNFEKKENNWKVLDLIYFKFSWERLAGLTLTIDGNSIYLSNIKYIHQLQNLYFALSGEELTLKKQ